MTGADDRILEYLSEENPAAPSKIHDDGRIRFSRPYINQRCQKLAEKGFLLNLGNGVYQITERGEAYLEGEFDAQSMTEVDDEQDNSQGGPSAAEGV
ncbi:MarR family transcriptional regulator [Haloplanus salinarum]|uniref:MarR family transcriptional regulator n=1 Tax=Haloplanus salinarum TaxID=1912324 RepID=UPI00214AAB19|nr:MarR family transcriptional regulator [Haloplanus salinarum]